MTGKTPWRPLLWLSLATVSPGNGQALQAKDGHPHSMRVCVLKYHIADKVLSLQRGLSLRVSCPVKLVFKKLVPPYTNVLT